MSENLRAREMFKKSKNEYRLVKYNLKTNHNFNFKYFKTLVYKHKIFRKFLNLILFQTTKLS